MITRYNYEEFFLLYTDNELSGAERKAVEEFVAANPDLKQELELLQQSVLKPENDIVFENKDLLMKESTSFINQNNYEEYFLLYTDNELNAAQKKEVEVFAARSSAHQQELHLLLQTRVEADTSIVFKNKNELYRKEKDERVIPIFWIRIAAAVVALILVLFFVFNNKSNVRHELANNNSQQQNPAVKDSPVIATNEIKKKSDVTSSPVQSLKNNNDEVKQQQSATVRSYAVKNTKKQEKQNAIAQHSDLPENIESVDPAPTVHVVAGTVASVNSNTKPAFADPSVNHATAAIHTVTNIVDQPADMPTDKQEINYAKQAVQKENIVANNEDVVYFGGLSAKKNSLRGLFRKVSRVLNRNADADNDDKHGVLIGSFQTALK